MQRRLFMRHAGLAGILAAGTAPALAQASPEVKWRCASSFPKALDTLFGGAEVVARRVASLTNNKFQIQVFAGGEIVPSLQVLEAAQNGTVECAHASPASFVAKDATFGFGGSMPFGLNTRQQFAWMYHGGGLALMRDFYRNYNVTSFPAGNTGAQMGGWFRKEIKSVADLKGLRFRIGGYAGKVLARLGALPQQLAGGDLYAALDKGSIDAAEWVGPYDDEKLGLNKVARYYYYPGWWEGGTEVSLLVNLKAYSALPVEYKAALDVACYEATLDMVSKYDALNPGALRRLVATGTELRPFARELLEACFKAANDQYDEDVSGNANFRKVFEPWKKFRDEEVLWFRVAEGSFDNFMMSMNARQINAKK